jgi:16S rRNA processing protein RimM
MPVKEDLAAGRAVVLGRVSGLFGVKGWLKVHSYTEPRDSILHYRYWYLQGPGDGVESCQVAVAEVKQHGKAIIVRFDGIEDRDAAAEFLDWDITIPRDCLPAPASGQYYWSDLEGMQVVHRDGRKLGKVAYLLATGVHDVMVVQGNKEVLVPFVMGTVILDVDTASGVVSVDWEWD